MDIKCLYFRQCLQLQYWKILHVLRHSCRQTCVCLAIRPDIWLHRHSCSQTCVCLAIRPDIWLYCPWPGNEAASTGYKEARTGWGILSDCSQSIQLWGLRQILRLTSDWFYPWWIYHLFQEIFGKLHEVTEEVLANDLILFLRALNPDIENIERVRNSDTNIYFKALQVQELLDTFQKTGGETCLTVKTCSVK